MTERAPPSCAHAARVYDARPMDVLDSPRWNLTVLLALIALFAVNALAEYKPYSFLHGDGAFYATTNRSILDGTLDQHAHQPASWYEKHLGWNEDLDAGWSNVALGRHGEFYPKHALPLPILATPLFFLFGYDGLLAFNVLAMVLALWLAWRLAVRWVEPNVATVTVLAMACVPLFQRGAYSYSNDVLYGALCLGAIERFFAGGYGWSGLLFGIALWCKATNIVLALPFGAWLLLRKQWRAALWMAGMAALPLAIWLVLNTFMFGGPFITAYNRILVRTGGHAVILDITDKFARPVLEGVRSVLFDQAQGLVPMLSLLLLGVVGLVPLAPRAPLLVAAMVASIPAFLWLHARYDYTYARFFTPWAALLIVPMACLFEHVLALLAAIGGRLRRWLGGLGRLRGALAIAAALLLLFGTAAFVHRDPHRWSAAHHIAEAKVLRGPAERAVPCDFFNPRELRWECAQLEGDAWQHWGRSLADDACRFSDHSQGWLWLHPNPSEEKTITFAHLPPGPIVVRYGLDSDSHYGDLHFDVRDAQGKVIRAEQLHDFGVVHEFVLPSMASVTLAVPRQTYDWRHFCVDLHID